jgi:hypothetical protein
MSTRNAIAVAKKHMAVIEQWTVHKVLKMQITLGTALAPALYMVWSADDQKRYPPKGVIGNVRVGLLQAITGGVHIFLFKDQTVRKIQTSNLPKVIEVSNSIFSSGLTVHRNDKTLTHQEDVGVTPPGDGEESEDDEGEEEDGSAEDNGEDSDGVAPKRAVEEDTSRNAEQDKVRTTSDGSTVLAAVVEKKDGNAVHDDAVVPAGVSSKQAAEAETGNNEGECNLSSTSEGTTSLPAIVPNLGPLYNPPPPPTTTTLQCSSTLPDTVRELRAMEALVKEKKR